MLLMVVVESRVESCKNPMARPPGMTLTTVIPDGLPL